MHRYVGRLSCALAVAIAITPLAGCAPGWLGTSDSSGEPVRIGLLAPRTGDGADEGRDGARGAQLAIDLVNDDFSGVPLRLAEGKGLPGLKGTRIRLMNGDTAGAAGRAAEETSKLVARDSADALIAVGDAPVTEAISQRSERHRVPLVDGTTSEDFLTELGLDWFFRAGPSDSLLARTAYAMLAQQQASGTTVDKIAILHANDDSGQLLAGSLSALAPDAGYEVVNRAGFSVGDSDLSAEARAAATGGPDVIVVAASTGRDAGRAVAALGSSTIPVLGVGDGFGQPDFDQAAGPDAAGLFRVTAWSTDFAARHPGAQAVAELYEQRYDTPMNETAAEAFSAVLTLAFAIDEAGSTEPDRIRGALLGLRQSGLDTIMPWNGLQFAVDGQNSLAAGVVEQRTAAGYRVVFPTELARSKPNWKGLQ